MSSAMRFDGQVAVVTGAGNGLGRAYAHLLASRGAAVIVNDCGTNLDGSGHSSGPADRVAAEIQANGGRAVANYDDVQSADGARAIIEAAETRFGTIDILVCNAGVWSMQPFEELDDALWERTIGVHLTGTMRTSRAAWPIMKRKNYGRIVFTASSGGAYGKGGLTAYGAAKGGIYGLMRCLANEVGDANIKVNTILPGAATRMVSKATAALWESNPGLGDPANVAPLVAYLSSNACTENGCAYSAGGGYFARDEMMQGKGARFSLDNPITPEMIAGRWAEINSMADPTGYPDVMAYGARMFGL